MNSRRFVSAVLAVTLLSVSAAALAQEIVPGQLEKPQAGYYRALVGDVKVTVLSDGTLPLHEKLFKTANRARLDHLLEQSFSKGLDTSINAFLLETDGKLILVDAGTGPLLGPAANKLPASLRAAGFETSQVTDILLTHIHPDHAGGLMDGATRVFPNATLHMERKEMGFWLDAANAASASEGQKRYFKDAQMMIGPYQAAGKVEPFDGATTLFPGITSIPAPGHTPGHTFYLLQSKGTKLLFWGDIIHVEGAQFDDPSVTIAFDSDPVMAAATRRKVFADAAAESYLIAAAHVSFPGLGHLRRAGAGYRWYPMPYLNDAH